MPIKTIVCLTLICCALSACSLLPDRVGDQELPPFDSFFEPAAFLVPQISPDGTWLSWIAPVDGVNNLFVAPRDQLDRARQLTSKTRQGVRATDPSGNTMYRWSADSRYLIYPHDYAGDENWDLWRVDIVNGEERNLTPSPDLSYEIIALTARHPNKIGVIRRKFGQLPFSIHVLDLGTAEMTPVLDSSQFTDRFVVGSLLNHDFNPVVLVSAAADGSFVFERRVQDAWVPLTVTPAADANELSQADHQKIYRVSADNRYAYAYSSRNRDTNALVAYDLQDGSMRLLGADERVDLDDVLFDRASQRPLAYAAAWVRLRWEAVEPSIAQDLTVLAHRQPDADFRIKSLSNDRRYWVVEYQPAAGSRSYQLYDRQSGQLKLLGQSHPALQRVRQGSLHPTVMLSQDGLPLISYYSLPAGSDPDGDGIPDSPMPTVMLVHGGPSDERASFGSSPFMQWLNSRGYVVYNVNYRGSAGFGKRHMLASYGEWGGKMHRDRLEQLQMLIERGVTDPDRIAILGGSYGGYATLVGMTMTPDVFSCGVEIVGPSNLTIPMPHWSPDAMAIFLGADPRTEEGQARLREISPVTHAHHTRGSLLIGQGANDSRVPQDQSNEIVDIMQKAGARVTYAVYPDEGHGFARVENSRSFWGLTEIFLGQCLGGRHEALGDKLDGSSIQVPVGAQHIQGLSEKLPKTGGGT